MAFYCKGSGEKERHVDNSYGIASMKIIELENCCINGNRSERSGERTHEGGEPIYLCAQDNSATKKREYTHR